MPKGRQLTALQKAFVREYLLCRNASEAMRRAGYTSKNPDVDAARLLVNPGIKALIEQNEKKLQKKFDNEQDRLINELRSIAYFTPDQVVTWGPDGVEWKSSEDISPEALSALELWGSPGKKGKGSISLKSIGKDRAIEMLGKQFGMWKDKDAGQGTNSELKRAAISRIQQHLRKRAERK